MGMGPCPWSCHSPGCGQGTDWSPGHDIKAFRKSCSHLIMVLSLLSVTLPGPTILPCLVLFFPHLLSWGALSKREEKVRAALGSQQPCQYILLGGPVYIPCSTPAKPETED